MSKLKIIGILAYNNDGDYLSIDDYEINIGDTIYMRKRDRRGKSIWVDYIVDFNLNSNEWFLGGQPLKPRSQLGKVVKIELNI